MKRLLKGMLITLMVPAAYAGTINAPYYFKEECLKSVSIDNNIPRRLEFSCDQGGRCFASDIFMNIVLNCAEPFGSQVINSSKIRAFLLDKNGFRQAENFDYT